MEEAEQPEEIIVSPNQQKISFNGLEVHFTSLSPVEAANLFIQLDESLRNKSKDKKYIG